MSSPRRVLEGASYKKRGFGLEDIRNMAHAIFVDRFSRFPHSKPVAGRGIAMKVAGYTNGDVRCNYYRGVGHLLSDCTILKAKGQ